MAAAMRSLCDPVGFKCSSLAKIAAPFGDATLPSCTTGVGPTKSRIEFRAAGTAIDENPNMRFLSRSPLFLWPADSPGRQRQPGPTPFNPEWSRAGGRFLDEDRWARLLQRSGAMLSERETEVLQLIAKGITNAEAAHALSLSKATIRTHLEHIYEKLEVTNRVEAVMEGVRQG